jgi:hypothetical protein
MNFLGPSILLLQGLVASDRPLPLPVVVVDDAQEVRRMVGLGVDGTFIPSQDEAEAPRRDLKRYLETERRRAKTHDRQRLRRIELVMEQYFWHCGGYVKDGNNFLFCSFVRFQPGDLPRLRQKAFPGIKDGGISVCRCHFNQKLGRIVRLDWNVEA